MGGQGIKVDKTDGVSIAIQQGLGVGGAFGHGLAAENGAKPLHHQPVLGAQRLVVYGPPQRDMSGPDKDAGGELLGQGLPNGEQIVLVGRVRQATVATNRRKGWSVGRRLAVLARPVVLPT